MLEETAPAANTVINCVVSGQYYYMEKGFPVEVVRDFLHMLKSVAPEKKRIILSNLHTRIDAIETYDKRLLADDIPF